MQREMTDGPVTAYTDYFSHGGIDFELTATRIDERGTVDDAGVEWSASAVCPEEPEMTFEFTTEDLEGADTPEQVFGIVRDRVASYLDQHLVRE